MGRPLTLTLLGGHCDYPRNAYPHPSRVLWGGGGPRVMLITRGGDVNKTPRPSNKNQHMTNTGGDGGRSGEGGDRSAGGGGSGVAGLVVRGGGRRRWQRGWGGGGNGKNGGEMSGRQGSSL